ncbi:4-hydroxy-tetrahydrodipicolinate reductase [Reinekea marinisedimentorum]|uniref:4-hydroxy-tetrahydrodipicolinate reductase n=1 Tax=Reinekea marinisedimentorum TaxID=230495 RepID=A0A4V2UK82_9GAMM|nr:4-hydroxy-tetrahydrodipicolinate reductase [Reinekea marinisedimentorum]TCS43242.1 4-hydroxy-tetrahydrodipicolinate reductase [Reinekea marinisedimentorum]
MQKLVVTGADGRMGRALIEAILDTEQTQLVGATVKDDSPFIGVDAGELIGRGKLGVSVSVDLSACLASDVTVIDFTVPVATLNHLKCVAEAGASIVIGTTGLNEQELEELRSYKEKVAMVFAGNYSVGVNLTLQLLRMAAKIIGDSSDIEVIEAHHRHKVDAPSGTALMMGEAVAGALNKDLKECGVFAREGITGAREPGTIGFSTIRGGDIVGEHTVMFASEGERVEISHKASSRQTFARGAVRAAKWLNHENVCGLYSMEDVLGF